MTPNFKQFKGSKQPTLREAVQNVKAIKDHIDKGGLLGDGIQELQKNNSSPNVKKQKNGLKKLK